MHNVWCFSKNERTFKEIERARKVCRLLGDLGVIDGMWEHFAAYLERFFTEFIADYTNKDPDVPGHEVVALFKIAIGYARLACNSHDRKTSSILESLSSALGCYECFDAIHVYLKRPTDEYSAQDMERLLQESELKIADEKFQDCLVWSACSEMFTALTRQSNRLRQNLGRELVKFKELYNHVSISSFQYNLFFNF